MKDKNSFFMGINWDFFGRENHQKAIEYDCQKNSSTKKVRKKRDLFESKFNPEDIYDRFLRIYKKNILRQMGLDFT